MAPRNKIVQLVNVDNTIIEIRLSVVEYKLYEAFSDDPYKLFSFDELWLLIWNFIPPQGNMLQHSICRLRKKLEAIGVNDVIICRRKLGYAFRKR